MNHIIRQQFFEVDLKGTESEGFVLQRQLSEVYYHKLVPAMEKAFNQWVPEDQLLVIDRIEIDAGTISPDRLEEDLTKRVAEALIQRIKSEESSRLAAPENRENYIPENSSKKRLITGVGHPEKRLITGTGHPEKRLITGNGQLDKRKVEAGFIRLDEMHWEVFTFFLQTGHLPWWVKLPDNADFDKMISELLFKVSDIWDGTFPAAQIMETLGREGSVKRLIYQFSEAFVLKLIQKLSPESANVINELFRVSDTDTLTTEEERRSFRQLLLEKAILLLSENRTISKVELGQQIYPELKNRAGLIPLVSKVFEHPLPEMKRIIKEFVPDEEKLKVKESIDPEIVEGIYIDNAGLVLLHPFLPRFFEALEIADDERILQSERAISLLYYLTTGQTRVPEYELVLPKILCGVPFSTTVPIDAEINDNEKSEAEALLEAVIAHWEALRNTSQDALRGTFLLRPGKLSQKKDGDWLLQVEVRTFDVLLDLLPWGISMIKLPWMKQMLWVEWGL